MSLEHIRKIGEEFYHKLGCRFKIRLSVTIRAALIFDSLRG